MVNIGINYLSENEECYRILKKYNFINTLKFPGKKCNEDELYAFVNYTKNNNFKIDLHGLPGMKPSFSCDNNIFIGNVNFTDLQQIFGEKTNITRFSTHMGLSNRDRLENYTKKQLEENWNSNYNLLKKSLTTIFKQTIEIGLENVPGGFDLDKKTFMPEFVSENWRKSDFGVFDISHAELSAKDLEMGYFEYIENLSNKDKVNIIHISGNISDNEKYKEKPDKHVMISAEEFENIIITLNNFKNVDLVVSEYAFSNKYSSKKETLIEAVTINTLVKYMDINVSNHVFDYIKNTLNDDISNAEEVLEKISDLSKTFK